MARGLRRRKQRERAWLAASEDADCLIVQARNFVGQLVALLQFMP
jgi:hypothetical protein